MTTIALAQPVASTARPIARTPFLFRERSVLAIGGLVLTTIGSIVGVLAASLIGPLIMFAVPFLFVFGCAFGPLHAMLKGDL